jgi:hypothetical protein
VLRTDRFELVANAFVDFERSRPPSRGKGERERSTLTALAACTDERCALRALGDGAEARNALGDFVRARWPAHAAVARAAMDRALALLVPAEDLVASRLAQELELRWREEPFRVEITAGADEDEADDPTVAPTVGTTSACFDGAAILECLFYRAVSVDAKKSALLMSVARARASLDELGKAKTENLARDIVIFAVGDAVRALSNAYAPGRPFRAARREEVEAFAWLGREWHKRTEGLEGASEFGARAALEVGAH